MKKLLLLFVLAAMSASVNAQYYWGDVNHDGNVDVADIEAISNMILNGETPEEINTSGNIYFVVNGHKCVDLGIEDENGKKVYFALTNIGAANSYNYGDVYGWGEVATKSNYSWGNYKYSKKGATNHYSITKYTFNDGDTKGIWYQQGEFIGDNITLLEKSDDVATQLWGDTWRIPTKEELRQLCTNCTWTWYEEGNTKYNKIPGYEVSGNGNSIFLPAGGFMKDGDIVDRKVGGRYWSSSLSSYKVRDAAGLDFEKGVYDVSPLYRYYGRSIRAVCTIE